MVSNKTLPLNGAGILVRAVQKKEKSVTLY